jgi:hypothetical protein
MEHIDLKTQLYVDRFIKIRKDKYVTNSEVEAIVLNIQQNTLKEFRKQVIQSLLDSLNDNLTLDQAIVKINLLPEKDE